MIADFVVRLSITLLAEYEQLLASQGSRSYSAFPFCRLAEAGASGQALTDLEQLHLSERLASETQRRTPGSLSKYVEGSAVG